MLGSLSLIWLIVIFVVSAGVVWLAGTWLSDTTEILSSRFHLGQAMGGIILLAVSTNLPETAITASAALHHNIGVAIGNLLGGVAIQTWCWRFWILHWKVSALCRIELPLSAWCWRPRW
jgi:cation:H+ antiporter